MSKYENAREKEQKYIRKEFLRNILLEEKKIRAIYVERGDEYADKISALKCSKEEKQRKSEVYISELIVLLNRDLNAAIRTSIEKTGYTFASGEKSYFERALSNKGLSARDRKDFMTAYAKMTNSAVSESSSKIINGSFYDDGISLSNRVWNLTKHTEKDIKKIIETAFKEGNYQGAAQGLRAYLNTTGKQKSTIVNTLVSQKEIVKRADYQAKRLARTSMTHSWNLISQESARKNPFTYAMKWNLSPQHAERMRGKRDICDMYAEQDKYGLGRGCFPIDSYPTHSHPNCICYSTTINRDDEVIGARLRNWTQGVPDKEIDEWFNDYY